MLDTASSASVRRLCPRTDLHRLLGLIQREVRRGIEVCSASAGLIRASRTVRYFGQACPEQSELKREADRQRRPSVIGAQVLRLGHHRYVIGAERNADSRIWRLSDSTRGADAHLDETTMPVSNISWDEDKSAHLRAVGCLNLDDVARGETEHADESTRARRKRGWPALIWRHARGSAAAHVRPVERRRCNTARAAPRDEHRRASVCAVSSDDRCSATRRRAHRDPMSRAALVAPGRKGRVYKGLSAPSPSAPPRPSGPASAAELEAAASEPSRASTAAWAVVEGWPWGGRHTTERSVQSKAYASRRETQTLEAIPRVMIQRVLGSTSSIERSVEPGRAHRIGQALLPPPPRGRTHRSDRVQRAHENLLDLRAVHSVGPPVHSDHPENRVHHLTDRIRRCGPCRCASSARPCRRRSAP